MQQKGRTLSHSLIHILIASMLCSNQGFLVSSPVDRTLYLVASKSLYSAVQPDEQLKLKYPKHDKQNRDDVEFRWLTWVYRQWTTCAPGEIPADVLKQMVPAIAAWSRRATMLSSERAETLLKRIIREKLAGNPNAVLSVSLFNSAMDAYAKIGNPEGVQRILDVMDSLQKKHHELSHLKPDVVSMSTLALALAKSQQHLSQMQAESILSYMESENIAPNRRLYNAILYALSLSSCSDKAVRVENLINQMEAKYASGIDECRPDIFSYQCLLLSWSRTEVEGAAQKCERLLESLELRAAENESNLVLNSKCFNAAIYAWARSKERGKASKAYNLFIRMKELYETNWDSEAKPNIVTLTTVINACTRIRDESEREDAFQIAELVFDEAVAANFGKPTFLTFAAFLEVCSSILPPSKRRDDIVRRTFEQFCEAGQVAQIVLKRLKKAASLRLYDELVKGSIDESGELRPPKKWTRRVRWEHNKNLVVDGTAVP